MIRSLMQVYVHGSVEAVATYQKAFDATLGSAYYHDDGSFFHSELDVYGQVLAVAEAPKSEGETNTGNVMQFCLHFEKDRDDLVKKAFETLKEGSHVLVELGPCMYSSCMVDFIDRFGVRWCLFVD